jgi:hypothetical protein
MIPAFPTERRHKEKLKVNLLLCLIKYHAINHNGVELSHAFLNPTIGDGHLLGPADLSQRKNPLPL